MCILVLCRIPNTTKHVRLTVCPSIRLPKCAVSVVNILPVAKSKTSPSSSMTEFEKGPNRSRGRFPCSLAHCVYTAIEIRQRFRGLFLENRENQPRPVNILQYENSCFPIFSLVFFRKVMMGVQDSDTIECNVLTCYSLLLLILFCDTK